MNSYHQVNPDDSIDRVTLKGQVIQSSGKVDSCELIKMLKSAICCLRLIAWQMHLPFAYHRRERHGQKGVI